MEEWNRIAAIIQKTSYPIVELNRILRGFYDLLEDERDLPGDQEATYRAINRALRRLKIKSTHSEQGKELELLLDTLRCLLHEKYFNVAALNSFLVEIKIPYQYTAGVHLRTGKFKMTNEGEEMNKMKYDRIFISHASKDRDIVNAFVGLLEDMGLGVDEIFYSSLSEYGVDVGVNIVDTLKRELSNRKVHVVFMLSQNYYDSVMCMHEMGAAWVMQHTYTSILLPGYTYEKIEGAIDAGAKAIKLDEERTETVNRLVRLRNQIQEEFCLPKMKEEVWNRKVDAFLKSIGR